MQYEKPKGVSDEAWKQHMRWIEVARSATDESKKRMQGVPKQNGRPIRW